MVRLNATQLSTSIYCKRGEKGLCTSFPQHITHSSKLGTWDSGNLAWSPDPCRAVTLVSPNLVRAHRSQMTCIFRHLDFGRQRRHLHKWPEKMESLRVLKTRLFGWLMPKGLVERIVLWYAALLPNPNANFYTMIMIMKYLTYSNDSKVCSIPLKWCVIFCWKKLQTIGYLSTSAVEPPEVRWIQAWSIPIPCVDPRDRWPWNLGQPSDNVLF